MRPKVFELDTFLKYNREKDLNIHRHHLQEIRKRKNYYAEINPLSNHVICSRKKTLFPEVNYTNNIIKDRLYVINHRENKTLQNHCLSPDESTSRRQKLAIMGISSMVLNKENFAFKKRMEATKSNVDVRKLEKDFQQSRNFIHQLRKISIQSQSVKDIFVPRDDCVQFPMLK